MPAKEILAEQVKTLYESIGSLVLINLVVSTALVVAFWDVVEHSWLLTWMATLLVMLTVRLGIYALFKRRFDSTNLRMHQWFLIIGSASAGIIWGAAGLVMFVHGQLEYQLLILLSLLAMASGSAFSLSIYLPAYFAFVPVMLAPIALQLFLIGDKIHMALGGVTVVFLIAQTLFNTKINRGISDAMALRFENLELIDQLRTQKAEAERANRAKSSFLAAASHDLRQPLYALSLFVSALEERDRSPGEQKIIDQIKRATEALQSLFDALLDISKLDAGTVEIQKIDFSLQEMLVRLAEEFNPQAAVRELTIDWVKKPAPIHSDPLLLEQILRNFIANAVRYTNAGGIIVSCESLDDKVKISVIDTGVGIPLKDQDEIFDEFYQLGNPERDRNKGLGLGLSIVQRAAEQLGHEIEVVSEPGQGSTFSVIVPIAIKSCPGAVGGEKPIGDQAVDSQPLIVVIEDEENIREGMQQLLELWGCEVIPDATADGALAQLSQSHRKPDGIISDFRLADGHTGPNAIEAVNTACQASIPALIITGDTEKALLITLKSSGHEVLHKPVPPAKLRAFLRSLPKQETMGSA